MTGFCPECGKPLEISGRCPAGHHESDARTEEGLALRSVSLPHTKIGPLPKPDTSRRLLGSGVEFFAYFAAKGVIAIMDALSIGLIGLASLILFGLIILRDCNAGAFNIAKRVSRMRVVDWRTGQPASNVKSLLRNSYYLGLLLIAAALPWIDLLTWFVFLLFVGLDVMMILASPRGRRFGDLLAGTQVIQERS